MAEKRFSCGIVTWDFPVRTSRSAVTERGSRSLGTSTAPSCQFSSQGQRPSRRGPSHPSFATCEACQFPTNALFDRETTSEVGTPVSHVDDIPIDPALAWYGIHRHRLRRGPERAYV
ncbi:hypothetical protein F5141DRAFT_392066 [Pisolithus sp. B1]|nr:hypothetical protein F5141DRAFT_392066 [Pisolithus sp. B1]